MRIAIVSDAIYPYNKGGKETRIHELSSRLVGLGHEVHIYCMKWWDGDNDRVEEGVHLHAISRKYNLYAGERRSIVQGIMFGLACFKLISKKYDIVDVDHMPFFPIFSVWLVNKIKRKRMYATWHEVWGPAYWVQYMGWSGRLAALIERASVGLPDRITAVSPHTAEMLASKLNRTRGVSVVANGINKRHLDSIQPDTANSSDIITAGRMLKHKNVDVLLRAVAIIAQQNPSIRCNVIGNGPEDDNLRMLAAQLGIEQQVRFIDFLPHVDDMYAQLKSSKVYVSPSEREGFGLSVLEANGCGLPSITVDMPDNAARWLIEEGVNGSVTPLDPQAIADSITHWLATEPTGLQERTKQLDWDYLATKLSETYTS